MNVEFNAKQISLIAEALRIAMNDRQNAAAVDRKIANDYENKQLIDRATAYNKRAKFYDHQQEQMFDILTHIINSK